MGTCPTFCDDGPPVYRFDPENRTLVARDLVSYFEKVAPRLGTVVWALGTQEGSSEYSLPLGHFEGKTAHELGRDRVPAYGFTVVLTQGARDTVEFRVTIVDPEGLGTETFSGEFWNGGRQGEMTIKANSGLARTLNWDLSEL